MKKRLLSVLLTLSMVLTLLPSAAFAMEPDDQWAGYTAIDSQEDLEAIANNMSGKYYLTDDITLTGTWTPLGHGSSGEYDNFDGTHFTGVLDGDGHTISGLNTGTDFQTYAGVGLFAAVGQSGQIKNLTLNGANVYGRYWVGGFAGLNSGTIENCHLTDSTVAGHEGSNPRFDYNYVGGSQIGGIAGWNQQNGTIASCSVTASSVLGNRYVGGVAGVNNGTIQQTFVRKCDDSNWIGTKYQKINSGNGSVAIRLVYNHLLMNGNSYNTPYMYVGGLVGANQSADGIGRVENCYVVSTQLQAIDAFGELIGVNWGNVKNCYTAINGISYYSYFNNGNVTLTPDYDSRNMNNSDGTVTGVHYYASRSLDLRGVGDKHYDGNDMQSQATYVGWDFENIWTLDATATADNYGYPVFGTTVQEPEDPEDPVTVTKILTSVERDGKTVELANPVSDTVLYEGDQVTWTIQVTNNTNTQKTYYLTDLLTYTEIEAGSAEMTYQGSVINSDSNTGRITVGGNKTATLTAAYTVAPDRYAGEGASLTNTVEVRNEPGTTSVASASATNPVGYTVKVTYSGNGGTADGAETKTVVERSESYPVDTPVEYTVEDNDLDFAYTGHSFDGWYTLATGGENVTGKTQSLHGGVTYYAHWVENEEPATQEVTLNFYDETNNKQVKEETITLPADATHVNTSEITVPDGYELVRAGDLPINDGYVYVGLRVVEKPTTQEVTLNFYDENHPPRRRHPCQHQRDHCP